jgi:hypothetical protein
LAVANYADANGHYPPAYLLGPDGRPWHSWRVLLLPYLSEPDLHKEYRLDEPWDGPNNSRLAEQMPKSYAFYGTKFPTATTNYLAVVGYETMWPYHEGRKQSEIKDGTNDTFLIVENNGLGVHWMEPRDLAFDALPLRLDDANGISSWYERPAVVTRAGMVLRLEKEMTPEQLRTSLTITGAKPAPGAGGATPIQDGRDRERKPQ